MSRYQGIPNPAATVAPSCPDGAVRDVVLQATLESLTLADVGALCAEIARLATEGLRADACFVLEGAPPRFRSRAAFVRSGAALGRHPEELTVELPPGSGPSLLFDAAEGAAPDFLHSLDASAAVATPIVAERTWGILLTVRCTGGPFSAGDAALAERLALLLGQGIFLRSTPCPAPMLRGLIRAMGRRLPALLWVTDTDLRLRHLFGAELLRLDPRDGFLGKTLYEVFRTNYLNHPAIAAHLRALRGETGKFRYRWSGMHLDAQVEPIGDGAGGVSGTVGVAVDVQGEDEATERLRLLSTAVESVANAILIADPEGAITWVNPAFARLTGYSREEVRGKNWSLLRSDAHDPGFYRTTLRTVLSGGVWEGEMRGRRKDGSSFTAMVTITPVAGDDGADGHFVAVMQDVTESKELQEQFQQAQKMEAIGRLAGGVAHDFNNVLTAITGYTDLLLMGLHEDDPRYADLQAIKTSASRAASLTRHLLAFSRKQVLQPRVIDLNETVAGMTKILRRLIGEDIELETRLHDALGRTRVDPGQIEQVILNLAVNARDAMPNGGKLLLETQNVELDEAYFRRHPVVQPGPYVLLAVSDTGTGMDREVLARIFEPFFTTKEPGKGTGLGLSTVYGIVKQSGGYVFAYSEPGMGTTFKVYLPRVDDPPEGEATEEPLPTPYGSETVLLVEDDDVVRRLARRFLESAGYRVLTARNGAEALLRAQEHEGAIHLMLTDVVMPLMGGRELAQRIAAVRPETKVVYMSGYTDEAIERHGVLDPGTVLLQKPFSKAAFLRQVRLALDGKI